MHITASQPKLMKVIKMEFIRLHNLKVLEKIFALVMAGCRV